MYIENPKTIGSQIVCCIPQAGECPVRCGDCFFQSGRSYLEPLTKNIPNMPDDLLPDQILRVNDGNDSNVDRALVLSSTDKYKGRRFFNTSIPKSFDEPWVLTVNPAKLTDIAFHRIDKESTTNLMYAHFRVNLWNLNLADRCVNYYTSMGVPVVFVFMAYFTTPIPEEFRDRYVYRKRTLNEYWCISEASWLTAMDRFKENPLVYSCSGSGSIKCKDCGICVREFSRVKRNSFDSKTRAER